eukprot:scaffold146_cov265-Pinguiococcus_pyrenoidosus.AAC.43
MAWRKTSEPSALAKKFSVNRSFARLPPLCFASMRARVGSVRYSRPLLARQRNAVHVRRARLAVHHAARHAQRLLEVEEPSGAVVERSGQQHGRAQLLGLLREHRVRERRTLPLFLRHPVRERLVQVVHNGLPALHQRAGVAARVH